MTRTLSIFFFFNDTATTEIYTLSLHDALPISGKFLYTCNEGNGTISAFTVNAASGTLTPIAGTPFGFSNWSQGDRKSTRLNSSHSQISYAVFCLKKKKLYNPYTDCDTDKHTVP